MKKQHKCTKSSSRRSMAAAHSLAPRRLCEAASWSQVPGPPPSLHVRSQAKGQCVGPANAARVMTLAASSDKRLGTKYVPSFIPPALAAANKTREEKPASVFDLPARGDKGKPRAIDAVLVEMQRCVLGALRPE